MWKRKAPGQLSLTERGEPLAHEPLVQEEYTMQSIALILVLTIAMIAGVLATDTQCKVMRPTSNSIVVACSAGRMAVQP
jgi:hypothetical protein